ncbi:cytochrome b5 domain-containing protein [Brevibacillus parabrevis]|uniref:cytochrome b5 domain-containing protein n=1 Tax=Brevibacillus parabrevis TaxID=54914 RepID=UPI000A52210B|nr:cytochrome b5 domain-containing protein [Brevibacillus parabrevis]
MNQRDYLIWKTDELFSEVNYLIRLLYMVEDPYQKSLMLNQLWNLISQLQFIFSLLTYPPSPQMTPILPHTQIQPTQPIFQHSQTSQTPGTPTVPSKMFTRDELAKFNGKNGNPAYVAVNGIVYDVTNNAAWSAATHFGLTAGKDLTQEFASCHAGQQWILQTMKPVGRLA